MENPRLAGSAATAATFVALVFACGGATTSDGGGSGTGAGGSTGSSSSSSTSTGTATGTGTTSGATTSGSSGGVCCTAAAVCNPGDFTIDGPDACPSDGDCYSNEVCCSIVWCARQGAQCDAYPTCDDGDRTLDGACPPAYSCYTRTLCGTTIWCIPAEGSGGAPGDGGTCNPELEPNRDYVGESPEICAVIRYACPELTEGFSNACGCGCEQSEDCPATVDCEPGSGDPDPLCTDQDPDPCPYTVRAL